MQSTRGKTEPADGGNGQQLLLQTIGPQCARDQRNADDLVDEPKYLGRHADARRGERPNDQRSMTSPKTRQHWRLRADTVARYF